MSWTIIIWSAGAGIIMSLALIHLLVWIKSRSSWANFLFFITASSAAVCSVFELGMMHAQTLEEMSALVQWIRLPAGILTVSLAWFIRLYLRSGHIWLIWLLCGVRGLVLAANFIPDWNFRAVTSIHQISLWGEVLMVPEVASDPWGFILKGSSILLIIIVIDAAIPAWKKGLRRQAGIIASTIIGATVFVMIMGRLMERGGLPLPFTLSLVFLIIVLGLAYELSIDLINARQLSLHLQKSQERMALAASAANLGLWEWDLFGNTIWANDVSHARINEEMSESFTFERFLQNVHPDDRAATRQAFERSIKLGEELSIEYRLVQHDGGVLWQAATGKVERDLTGNPLRFRGVSMDITKRKIAENALFKSEQLARILLNRMIALTHLLDEDGTIIDLNEPMAQLLGHTREKLIGTNVFDSYSPETIERRKKILRRVALEQKMLRFEEENQERVYDVIVFPVETLPGEKQQFVVFAQDITERKQTEDALKRSEEKFRNLMEQAPDPIVIWNPDGTISDFNQAWVQLWGFSVESLHGVVKRYNILKDKNAAKHTSLALLNKVFTGESEVLALPAFQCKPQRVAKDAGLHPRQPGDRWIAPHFYPVKGQNSRVMYVVNVQEDITERKEAERTLQESEARLKEAHRIARLGTWEIDILTNKITWSNEIFHILKVDRRKMNNSFEPFLSLIHEEDRETVRKQYLQLCTSHEADITTFRILQPDGRIQYLQQKCEPYCDPRGRPLRCIGTVQDITDRMTAQQERIELRYELAHLNRLLTMNELSSSLAHEINQPLGAIMNNVAAAKTLCSRFEESSEEIVEILEDVIGDANRAGQIIRKVRGIVKKEETIPEYIVLHMTSLVDDVLDLLHNTLRLNNITVHLKKQPGLFPVRGDRIRLQQVLMNLVTNSVAAMQDSPKKELTVHLNMQSSDEFVVSVSDTGRGINENIRKKLFQPFVTTKKDGLGVGLRICRSIIEDHGGRVWLEKDTDEGATFSFMLNTCPRGDVG